MASNQNARDLDLLKQEAEDLWERQQEVFAAAGRVARAAGAQGAGAVRAAAGRVAPVASSTIATVAAMGDQGVREILARLARVRGAAPAPVVVAPVRRGPGIAGWIGIAVGAIAIGAVAYGVWQTLRADDDLWIEDEDEPAEDSDQPKSS